MKRDALENIVRDAMTDVEVALNTDEIWRGVEQKLYPKKKKRFGWFLWGFALLALIAFAVIPPMSQSQKPAIVDSGNATKTNTSTMSLNSASVSDQEAEAQLADLNIEASSIDIAKQPTTQTKEQNVNDIISTDIQPESTNRIKQSSTLLNAIDKTKETSNSIKYTLTKKAQIGTTLLVATNKNSNNNNLISTSRANSANINNSSTIIANAISENDERELINVPTLRRPIPILKMINFKTVWAIVLPILNEVENLIEDRLVKEKTKKIKISKTPKWAWYLDLLMGVDKPYRSLSGDDLVLLTFRNSSETVLEGWHAQLTTGLQHMSGIYTDFGLSVSNITEAVDVHTERQFDKVGDVETSDLNKFSQRSSGKTTGNNTILETTKGTVYSRHTYYSIPLSLGYEMPFNKWSIAGEIGTEINLLKHSKGHQLNEDNQLISYNTIEGNSNIFLKRVGLNWNAKLKLAYKIKENQSVYLSPYILMSDKSITQNQYALKQKYNRYGIALGYKIYL